jgi:predicted nucleotidyltransferase
VELAQGFASGLDASVGVRAAVVVGSVARGDFHAGSEVNVLLVADGLSQAPMRAAMRAIMHAWRR